MNTASNVSSPYYYKCPTGHIVPVNGSVHHRLQSGQSVNVVDHGEINANDWQIDHKPYVKA